MSSGVKAKILLASKEIPSVVFQLNLYIVGRVSPIQQPRTTHGRTDNRKMNARVIHRPEYLVFNRLKRMGSTAHIQLQMLPDVVPKYSCGVISNAGSWVLAQDAANRDRVVGIYPEREFAVRRGTLNISGG